MISGKVAADSACRGRSLFAHVGGDTIDDVVEGSLRPEAGNRLQLFHAGYAPHHVFEAWFVGSVVRDVGNLRRAAGTFLNSLSEIFDGDLLRISDIDDFPDRAFRIEQLDYGLHGVPHIAKTTRLFSVSVNINRAVVEGLLDEIREH